MWKEHILGDDTHKKLVDTLLSRLVHTLLLVLVRNEMNRALGHLCALIG